MDEPGVITWKNYLAFMFLQTCCGSFWHKKNPPALSKLTGFAKTN
jgi:hypothetical protein